MSDEIMIIALKEKERADAAEAMVKLLDEQRKQAEKERDIAIEGRSVIRRERDEQVDALRVANDRLLKQRDALKKELRTSDGEYVNVMRQRDALFALFMECADHCSESGWLNLADEIRRKVRDVMKLP